MGIKTVEVKFDNNSLLWDETPGYNAALLRNLQEWANVQLQKRGHVFLNEVFDMLGMGRTREGQILGWLIGEEPFRIDFGFYRDTEFIQGSKSDVRLFMTVQENAHLFI